MTENACATGFVEDIAKIKFSFFNSNFDPETLAKNREKMDALFGGLEGSDGDIFQTGQYRHLIVAQARILNSDEAALGDGSALGAYNQKETLRRTRKLGLQDGDGNLDYEVLKAFGLYTRKHHHTGKLTFDNVHRHLYEKFPDKVEMPEQKTSA